MQNTEHIIRELIRRDISITAMESCTSGLIASMITDIEGASAVFRGSFVTYSNEAKVKAGVDREIIEKYGVYSVQCARAMAQTAREAFNTELGIGITGTTGNIDPDNADSVKGEVYFCICTRARTYDFEYHADVRGMSRHNIKELYAEQVFEKIASCCKEI